MPDFIPFKALRPDSEYMSQVSARSSDFSNQKFLVDAMRANPHTFHHVTKNHLNSSGAFQEPEKYLPFAAKFIDDIKEKGILITDPEASYYVYKQITKDGRRFKGIIGLTSVDDYNQDKVKKHEEIRPSRLGFMVELCKTTRVLGEPTLLTYNSKDKLDLKGGDLICDFTSVDGKRHIIERISDTERIEAIRTKLAELDAFYLADGHHRSAAIADFHNKFPQMNNGHFISLLMDENELEVSAFHRLIRSVETIETQELIERLGKDFEITKINRLKYQPKNKAEFGMFDGKDWYQLKLKYAEHMMDVELMEKYVVRSIYNITDSRTDSQISFTPQSTPLNNLEQLVQDGAFNVVYTLKAPSFAEIREISDRHEVLPPKSTFIEPKLRAGMIIQEF